MEAVDWSFDDHVPETGLFVENQVGSVSLTAEPVHADSPWGWVADQLKANSELFALPVERDGGVVGLIAKAKILEKASKFLENLIPRPLDQELTSAGSLDARESVEKVIIELLKAPALDRPEIFLVYLDGKFYGMTNLRRLASRSAELRDQDIQKAREFQELTMKSSHLSSPHWQLASLIRMAFGVGGDYYQEAAWPQANLGMLACFDVSGKAVAGSLVTASLTGFFSALRQEAQTAHMTPLVLAQRLNQFLQEILPLGTFVAGLLLFVPLTLKTDAKLEILNFGYGPVYFYQRQEKRVAGKALKPNFFFNDTATTEITASSIFGLSVEPGTKVYAFSDGMTDLINPLGEGFGEERLRDFLTRSYKLNAAEFIAQLQTQIASWQETAPQPDDITAVTFQF
ncbi:MAG: serine/threonine-protein phosphatase [Spirochaetales bacterium]|nr:serine/threonine-protein phosphatase [Spirochaetales bacterium]